jgi:acylpyruvate hydrolase
MKIICIGRNYAEHAKELKNDVPTEPVFFMKPDTALLSGRDFYYPDFTSDLHYEVELVIRISKAGKHINEDFAAQYYNAITVGIDFTARDVQAECKKKGLPWEKGKAFDNSAPVGEFIALKEAGDPVSFSMSVNGEVRQQGVSSDMIFPFNSIIAFVSKYVTLKTGDLIFTGTPAGVGPVKRGDQLRCSIGNRELLAVNIR